MHCVCVYVQLYMMRTMLESLVSEKAVSGRKALRADLKESNIPEFEAFHRNSFFFSHLLRFSGETTLSPFLSFPLSLFSHLLKFSG